MLAEPKSSFTCSVCKHCCMDICITVLVLVLHNHYWNDKTEIKSFGPKERRREREREREKNVLVWFA